ncbi:acetyl-CoA carboxylase, carboxyltransferase component [Babesia caballi]|uniref:Acetyl-CoA carboxylase, carboxyltransferase component n=1 Tax=Babesia caballi TaxID=5871 RepID=A0AAV4M0Q8_BABCB|nr:acetyl-CoA carboxylase, carboxyltransferase component [Babesia caballi]
MSRQKGAHESVKAADVEAVGATGQGGEPRVPGEGGGDGAGGLYRLLLKRILHDFGDFLTRALTIVKILIIKANGSHVLAEGGGTAANVQLGPPTCTFAPPVKVSQTVEQNRRDAQEYESTLSSITVAQPFPIYRITFICGSIIPIFSNTSIFNLPALITDKLLKTISQLGNRTTGVPCEPSLQLAQVLFTEAGTVVPDTFKVSLEGLEICLEDFKSPLAGLLI